MDQEAQYLMLQNHGDKKIAAVIRHNSRADGLDVFECSFETGKYYETEYSGSGRSFQIPVTLLPYQSRLIGIGKNVGLCAQKKCSTVMIMQQSGRKPKLYKVEGVGILK